MGGRLEFECGTCAWPRPRLNPAGLPRACACRRSLRHRPIAFPHSPPRITPPQFNFDSPAKHPPPPERRLTRCTRGTLPPEIARLRIPPVMPHCVLLLYCTCTVQYPPADGGPTSPRFPPTPQAHPPLRGPRFRPLPSNTIPPLQLRIADKILPPPLHRHHHPSRAP